MIKSKRHPHQPVLLEEVVSALITKKSGTYLDCTIGFGGHSTRILDSINENKSIDVTNQFESKAKVTSKKKKEQASIKEKEQENQ